MRTRVGTTLASSLGLLALFVLGLERTPADEPDPNLKPSYGSVKLKAGFSPDPFSKKLEAGGPIKTKRGAVTAYVNKAPDFRLHYTAGDGPLRIFVESKGDTTLLVNLPDSSWYANDDGGPGKNPQITFDKPKSGQYDIWVGTVGTKTVDATLKITKHASGPAVAKAKTITLMDVEWGGIAVGPKKVEIRVYQIGQTSEIYKSSRTIAAAGVALDPWQFRQGPWAVTKKGVDIQFWEINSGLFERDRKLGSTKVGAATPPGVRKVNFDVPGYEFALKYRIDN